MRGKRRDRSDTLAARAIIVSRPLYASIDAGHVRRKLTHDRRRPAKGGDVGTIPSRPGELIAGRDEDRSASITHVGVSVRAYAGSRRAARARTPASPETQTA